MTTGRMIIDNQWREQERRRLTLNDNIRFLRHYLAQMTEDNWRDNREHCDRLVREMLDARETRRLSK